MTPARLLTMLVALCIFAAGGCKKPIPEQPAPSPTETPLDQYLTATVVQYLDLETQQPLDAPVRTLITDTKEVARLSAFFPDMGQGKESSESGVWQPAATIEFELSREFSVLVKVSPNLDNWTEGTGDWTLKPDFAAYFKKLLGR